MKKTIPLHLLILGTVMSVCLLNSCTTTGLLYNPIASPVSSAETSIPSTQIAPVSETVLESCPYYDGFIVTEKNFSDFFCDSTDAPSMDTAYFIYDDIVWSTEYTDSIIYDAFPSKGEYFLGIRLEQLLEQNLYSDKQLVGIYVEEADLEITAEKVTTDLGKYGFTADFTTDETLKKRYEDYLQHMNVRYSNEVIGNRCIFVGEYRQLKAFLHQIPQTDSAYTIGLAPCFHGVYSEKPLTTPLSVFLNPGEIYLNSELVSCLLNHEENPDAQYMIAVKFHHFSEETNNIYGYENIIRSYGDHRIRVQFTRDFFGNGGSSKLREAYFGDTDFNILIQSDYATLKKFVQNNLSSNIAFTWYLAPFLYDI